MRLSDLFPIRGLLHLETLTGQPVRERGDKRREVWVLTMADMASAWDWPAPLLNAEGAANAKNRRELELKMGGI